MMWTFVALFGLLVVGKNMCGAWLFWVFWVRCLSLHVVAMWIIFDQLLPRLIPGTYVVRLAFVESLLLFVMLSKLERKVALRLT